MDEQKNGLPVEQLINSIGVLAEMTKLFRDQFIKAGFSKEEAYDLTKNFLDATLKVIYRDAKI